MYQFKTEPFDHQRKALEGSWSAKFHAYFMEMGTGKSKVAIDNMGILYDKGEINAVLIVAPKGGEKTGVCQSVFFCFFCCNVPSARFGTAQFAPFLLGICPHIQTNTLSRLCDDDQNHTKSTRFIKNHNLYI